MGEENFPRDIKGPAQGQARQVIPITAAVWPDPALVPLPGQPSAGTPSTRCWLPGRRRSPPPRGTSSQTGPARPACPCSGPSVPLSWGPVGRGPRCRLTLEAQGPASALPFLYCGGREGAWASQWFWPPITASSPDSVFTGSSWNTAPLCAPGSPGFSTTGTLPASDPQEACGHMALGPPSTPVQTLLGCPVRRGSSSW